MRNTEPHESAKQQLQQNPQVVQDFTQTTLAPFLANFRGLSYLASLRIFRAANTNTPAFGALSGRGYPAGAATLS